MTRDFDDVHIHDMGGIKNLEKFLIRWKVKAYWPTKYGFKFDPKGEAIIKNENMRLRAMRAIRKHLNLPIIELEPKILEEPPPTATAKLEDFMKGETMNTMNTMQARTKETFIVALSSYERAIAVFMPARFVGQKFSIVYDQGTFLVSRDDREGIEMNPNSFERGSMTFPLAKWFPDLKLPVFNQLKAEIEYDGDSFEFKLPLGLTAQEEKVETAPPIKIPPPAPQQNKEPAVDKTTKERAREYIAWLNEFAASGEYNFKTINGRLVLERQERIG